MPQMVQGVAQMKKGYDARTGSRNVFVTVRPPGLLFSDSHTFTMECSLDISRIDTPGFCTGVKQSNTLHREQYV